jgi:hypothetical protein
MNRRKPTEAEFQKFWSVFEAEQQRRKKNKTIPPSNFTKDDKEQPE